MMNIGVKKQANVISEELENGYGKKGFLVKTVLKIVQYCVIFVWGLHAMSRAVNKHHTLRTEMLDEPSQLQLEYVDEGNKCLVYREDFVTTKAYDGRLADRKLDKKEVWIYPNLETPERCTVRLVEKYLSLCPLYYKKSNFYLQCLQCPIPKQWYTEQVTGVHIISKVVCDIMDGVKIQGFSQVIHCVEVVKPDFSGVVLTGKLSRENRT